MRPVTKGVSSPAIRGIVYRFDTDADLDYQLEFKANGAVGRAMGIATAPKVTVRAIQDALLESTKGAAITLFKIGVTSAQQNAAIKVLFDRLSELYRSASPYLQKAIGDYCSFCEVHLPGRLDVEHRVPKGGFPQKFVMWDNFLRSCNRCNSFKSTKPSRVRAAAWAGGAPTEDELMQAVADHWIWPDLDASSFRLYDYVLCDAESNYDEIPGEVATALDMTWRGWTNGRSYADLALVGGGTRAMNHQIEVTVRKRPGAAVKRTHDLLGLGKHGGPREAGRTLTWFRTVTLLRNLIQLIEIVRRSKRKEGFAIGWETVLTGANALGFYSTQVTVMLEFPYPDYLDNPNHYLSLAELFVEDTGPTKPALVAFRGTDTSEIP